MRFALAQLNPTTGDLEGNISKIISEIELAKQKSADLIVFPEMAITGYCISDLIEDNNFVIENKEAIEKIALHTKGIVVIVGFIDYDSKRKNENGTIRKYNAVAILQDGKLLGIAHKSLLANYRYFDDKRYFSPAEKREPISIRFKNKVLKLGVSICEDMWDEDYSIKPIKELAEKGADLIININASPFFPGKILKREQIIKRHVKNTGKPFIYLNTVGAADNGKNIIPFDGQSLFYDTKGDLIAVCKQFEEEILFVDFDLEKGFGKPIILPQFSREKDIYEALVMSLRDYARKNGFLKAIEPLSGGIDSALGLAICVEAFGAKNVVAFNLPSKFNTQTTKSIAESIAKNFGVEYKVIPIQEIDDKVRGVFENGAHRIKNGVAKENLHARIRGLLMMLESNDTGALLVSNGNETEIALGYATLYGDMCGGISVIGDLSKVDVYKIARYVNERFGKEMIVEEAFKIKPSAELSEGQFDPFDYYVVAPIVSEFAEKRRNPLELIALFKERKLDHKTFIPDPNAKTVYDKHTEESFKELVFNTYNLFRKSVYKRLQGPPIISVSERAFGFDLRETIINRWNGK